MQVPLDRDDLCNAYWSRRQRAHSVNTTAPVIGKTSRTRRILRHSRHRARRISPILRNEASHPPREASPWHRDGISSSISQGLPILRRICLAEWSCSVQTGQSQDATKVSTLRGTYLHRLETPDRDPSDFGDLESCYP